MKLNGQSSHLMIDTGAGGIVVDRRVAEKAGVTRIVDAKTSGIGDKGDVAGYVGYVKSIQVGGLEFHDCYLDVYGKRSVQGDGLIGTDVFSSFLVDVDFPAPGGPNCSGRAIGAPVSALGNCCVARSLYRSGNEIVQSDFPIRTYAADSDVAQ